MHNTVRFILADRVEEVRDCAPTDTLLDFLRDRKNRTGSKEGCAEGDCGACTVVLAEAVDGRLQYSAVNSCILFLPTLDGKQVITVEDLQQEDGSLHPVQQAMVDQHGSQCGFCTPGFVMSLFARYHHGGEDPPRRREIDECLAGNLCRCTGYVPIVNAAKQCLAAIQPDQFSRREQEVLGRLGSLVSGEMLEISKRSARYFAPSNIRQLCALLESHPDATMLAGGTDVGLWVTKQLRQLDTVIYTGKVKELQELRRDEEAGELVIGAAVTYSRALPHIIDAYPGFEELLLRLGALQVRNAGTIGGNIANGSPIGDMPPGLIALEARLVLASSKGERIIPLEAFFIRYGQQDLRPGECIARILLPLPGPERQFRTYKVSKRIEQDISAVCAAFCMDIRDGMVTGARACYGGMAATPKRASHCEAALTGQRWNESVIELAMKALEQDFEPISDMRASAAYRASVARNLLKRFYLETSGADHPLRLSSPYTGRAGA